MPIIRVDEAAYHHDLCYAKNQDTRTQNKVCDREMLRELAQITNSTLRKKLERGLVGNMIKAKTNLGFGLKTKKKSKWTDQLAEELHKPVTRKFRRRKVYVNGIDKIWAADLVDMLTFSKYNKGVKYMLTAVDICACMF